jgi:hypothetical protein
MKRLTLAAISLFFFLHTLPLSASGIIIGTGGTIQLNGESISYCAPQGAIQLLLLLNDAPVIDDLGNTDTPADAPVYTETNAESGDWVALDVDGDALASDVDVPADWNGYSLTVAYGQHNAVDAAKDGLQIGTVGNVRTNLADVEYWNGAAWEVIGLIDASNNGSSGASLEVTFNASATSVRVSEVLRALQYNFAPTDAADADDNSNYTQDVILNVTVSDGTDASNVAAVTVDLQAVNDTPTDLALSNNTVNQSGGSNAVVGVLTTTDPDVTDTHTYSLVSGTGNFNIFNNAGTWELRANDASALAAGDYDVRIETDDGNGGPHEEQFTISVVDDFGPTGWTDNDPAADQVVEGDDNGTSVGLDVDTFDQPTSSTADQNITYNLTNSAGGRFQINATTGEVTVLDGTLLDYETAASHTITVQADAGDGNPTTRDYAIAVVNVNPMAAADAATAGEDDGNASKGNVLTNDTDPNGPSGAPNGAPDLSVSAVNGQAGNVGNAVAGSSGGLFTIGGGGAWAFNPNGGFEDLTGPSDTRTTSVTYTTTDGTGNSVAATVTVTVGGVNDAPVLGINTGAGVYKAETVVLTTAMLDTSDVDDTDGDLTYTIETGSSPLYGTLERDTTGSGDWAALGDSGTFTQQELVAGRVRYVHGGSENSDDHFDFQVKDPDGLGPAAQTFDITMVNESPVLDGTKSPTLTSIVEDAGDDDGSWADGDDDVTNPNNNQGTLVYDLIDLDDGSGVDNVTDLEEATPGMAITAVEEANGTWQYHNGTLWQAVGTVSEISALLLDPGYKVRFIPNPDYNGTATFTFRAWDQSSGSAGTRVDTTAGGTDPSPFSLHTDTAEITVTPVNDPPTLWYDGIVAGDGLNEGGSIVLDNTMLQASDVDNTDAELTYTIEAGGAVSNGTLQLDTSVAGDWSSTVDLVAGDSFTEEQLAAGRVRYVHDGSENHTDSFTFSLEDLAGVAHSGLVFNIAVNAVNDPPVLLDKSPVLATIDEDTPAPSDGDTGTLVSDLVSLGGALANVTDAEGVTPGIAIIGANTANGTWHYSTDGGASWNAVGTVSDTSALLLAPNYQLYFQPTADWNGTMVDAVTFRAWDQTSGAVGTKVDASGGGTGDSSFSAATDTAAITVNPINDAPVLDNAASPVLTAIDEDATDPAGDTVASIVVDGSITEPAFGESPVEAIAVTAVDNANGTWQYYDGGAWQNIETAQLGAGKALLLATTDQVRFVPTADWNGTATFTFRAWDQSQGSAQNYFDISTTGTGGISPFSTATDTAEITVTPINDPPVLDDTQSPALTAIDEDNTASTGDTVAAIVVDGSITEPTFGESPVEAIAVTAVDDANGTWQYDNGGGWTNIGPVSNTSALLLAPTDEVRFVPAANWHGTATFTFRAWDQSTGAAGAKVDTTGAGTNPSPFSFNTDTAQVTVTPVNDPPTLWNDGIDLADGLNEGGNIVLTSAMLDATDVDNTDAELIYTIEAGGAVSNGWLQRDTSGAGDWSSTVNLVAGGTFTEEQLVAGRVRYVHDGSENHADSFTFSLKDLAGVAHSGRDFNIAVNDTLALLDKSPVLATIDEDTPRRPA